MINTKIILNDNDNNDNKKKKKILMSLPGFSMPCCERLHHLLRAI